jgi:hypothetical protein
MFENALRAYEDLVRTMARDDLVAEHKHNVERGFIEMAAITGARLREFEQQLELSE